MTKVKDLYVGSQKMKEAWTLSGGVMRQVFSELKTPAIGSSLLTIPGTASASFTAAVPSAGAVGDLMLTVIAHEGTLSSFPAGWTRLASQTANNWGRIAVFTKLRAASEPGIALGFGQAKRHVVRIMSITGGKSATATSESFGGAYSKVYLPRIVVPKPKSLIVTAVGWRSASAPTFPWPAPHTSLARDAGAAVSSAVTNLGLATRELDTPATLPDWDMTASVVAIGGHGAASIAIAPT